MAAASHVLVSVPPDAAGDPVLRRLGPALAAARPRWVGYLSTTGVYGDHGGGWVDEDAALDPINERSRWRVAAERAWLATGLPVMVFRLAGIYGPGRSALDRVREGRAQRVVKPGQVFSRIHVDDIAAVLRAAMARGVAGRAYNVADDEPAPPQDVIAYAAELLGMDAAAGGALRGGRAVADGAELLRGIEAGGEPADPRGARGRARLSRPIARGCGRSSRRAGRWATGGAKAGWRCFPVLAIAGFIGQGCGKVARRWPGRWPDGS